MVTVTAVLRVAQGIQRAFRLAAGANVPAYTANRCLRLAVAPQAATQAQAQHQTPLALPSATTAATTTVDVSITCVEQIVTAHRPLFRLTVAVPDFAAYHFRVVATPANHRMDPAIFHLATILSTQRAPAAMIISTAGSDALA